MVIANFTSTILAFTSRKRKTVEDKNIFDSPKFIFKYELR
jgi:hypothetical protein